jgi:hypothetical protein
MSGNVRLFQIELTDRASGAQITLAGGRQFDENCYYLEFSDFTMQLWADETERFAAIARYVLRRRQLKKPGECWTRELGNGADLKTKLQFGVTENNLAYVEVKNVRVECDEGLSDTLVAVLSNFAVDIGEVSRSAAPLPRPYAPGRYYRSRWMPIWD